MVAELICRDEAEVTIQIRIPLTRSMLETEETIQKALNEAGVLATGEALNQFDTDGGPIEFGATRMTSKGQEPKTYQTPYGEVVVSRHVYQTSLGGATFCPLEREARIILTSTPRFAMLVSNKYGEMAGGRVVKDLANNHGRHVTLCFVQDLAAAVATVVQAKEEAWHYAIPKLPQPVAAIGVGLDGTCTLLVEEGKRQVMVGTISLYDQSGDRLHTIYLAASPEYGKATFYDRLSREVEHVMAIYPKAHVTGVADGSEDNWSFLSQYSKDECVDFYHAAEYLTWVAKAVHPGSHAAREQWLQENRHRLKHEQGAAAALLEVMKNLPRKGLSETVWEELEKATTYFSNQHQRMNYAQRLKKNLPIGSGVTEAACKTIVKMRLCRGGAKWKEDGAALVLSLRTLIYTEERWQQFWAKVNRYGFPVSLAL
jgi:hypothetical protein